MKEVLLHVNNLAFAFHQRYLFRNISFTVNPGEVLQISGPNGVGKSTLLSLIAGLRTPESGSIDVTPRAPTTHHLLEYLSAEHNNLFYKLSALDNLRFWAKFSDTTLGDDRLVAALSLWGIRVDLPYISNLPVEKFSTGMKRRVALARFHISSAGLWILDEPFFGLDHAGQQKLHDMAREHLASGGSIVYVSHDEADFEQIRSQTLSL